MQQNSASGKGLVVVVIWLFGSYVQAQSLPQGIDPLPEAKAQTISDLAEETAKHRGLPLLKKVASGSLNEHGLSKRFLEMFQEEMPSTVLVPMEKALKCFGLLPPSMDLATYYPKLMSSQIAGYYDPTHKYLVLVNRDTDNTSDMPESMDNAILVHEINHAIQDQHFDLSTFGTDTPLSDKSVARLALVEGDATLVMYSYMLGMPIETLPGADMGLKYSLDNPSALFEMAPNMPGAKEMMAAPAYLRDSLLFSYIQGAFFCIKVRQAGGQKLLDHAFRADPPRSSEQIIHPKKWLQERDDPVVIPTLKPGRTLAKYKCTSRGSMGELGTRLMLAEQLGESQRSLAKDAAAGWGGDAFALYEKKEQKILVWLTEWDDKAQKTEFLEVANKALKETWFIADAGPTRVILIQGELRPKSLHKVVKALTRQKVTRPQRRSLDLAALGISEADKPSLAGPDEALALLDNPVIKNALGGGKGSAKTDIDSVLENPETRKMILERAKTLLGDQSEGFDIEAMMDNPMVRQMMEQMLKPGEAPKGSVEGEQYTNKMLGFSIRKPTQPGWKINQDASEKVSIGPKELIRFQNDDHSILVVTQQLPMAIPIEMMAQGAEMGIKMQFSDYQLLKADFVEHGQKAYQMEYTGTAGGELLHFLQRFYVTDKQLVMVIGMASELSWEEHKAAILESQNSITFFTPDP